MTRTTTRFSRLVVLLLAALVAASLTFSTAGSHGNAGTVKVKEEDTFGSPENHPHVDCPFWIEGFGMAAESGNLTIKGWPPTGNMEVVLEDDWTGDGGDEDGYHFLNGPYFLPEGHYKLFVSNVHGHYKHKVFWVDECDREVPFFTSGAALLLAVVGALGGALLVLRRRA